MVALLKQISATQAKNGKSPQQQLLEIVGLRLRSKPIGISEYFEYGLWNRSVTKEKLNDFIGWRQSGELDNFLNDDHSRVLANDKLLNYLVLNTAGYPIPKPIASYSSGERRIANEKLLRTHEEVLAFLNTDVYPFYVKPISAGYGHGVMGATAKEGETIRLMDGSQISLQEFMKPFGFPPYHGMLFQEPLIAHPAIQEVTGTEAVCCVRFICFVTSNGPRIHTAFWKITAGRNMLDNFSHGDYGNCLGAINIDNGIVVRAISHMGPDGQIERHPTTGKTVIDFQLPDWTRAMDMVLSASAHFPGLRLQNWDVAMCPDGPVLLELNTESELHVPQAISGRGFMDERLRKILSEIRSEKDAYNKWVDVRHTIR